MKRPIRHWQHLSPQAVSDGSRAQSFYCIEAARADILELSRALMWAFDRTEIDGGMTEAECRRTAEEIGKVLIGEPSVAAQYTPNEWDASAKLFVNRDSQAPGNGAMRQAGHTARGGSADDAEPSPDGKPSPKISPKDTGASDAN